MDGEDLTDLFSAFGPVSVRRMFGGAGVYADGVMFALEAGGVLYLKADDAFAGDLAARGSGPFAYDTAKGRHTIASYWQVPEAAMDDAEDLAALARRALGIARAAAARRPPKKAGAKGCVKAETGAKGTSRRRVPLKTPGQA